MCYALRGVILVLDLFAAHASKIILWTVAVAFLRAY